MVEALPPAVAQKRGGRFPSGPGPTMVLMLALSNVAGATAKVKPLPAPKWAGRETLIAHAKSR